MEMFDVSANVKKELTSKAVKKYKGFQGTIKSAGIQTLSLTTTLKNKKTITNEVTCVATCGLDRFLRVHNTDTSELIAKVYLKSRLNCLLFSKHEPLKVGKAKSNVVDDDQLSSINSQVGTDDLWSDMETIVEEHPNLKRKQEKRLEEFDSEVSDAENKTDDTAPEFKMPKYVFF